MWVANSPRMLASPEFSSALVRALPSLGDVHSEWRRTMADLRSVGLATDLTVETLPPALRPLLVADPTPEVNGAVLAAYYSGASNDVAARLYRVQRDGHVDFPAEGDVEPSRAVARLAAALGDVVISIVRHKDSLELRTGTDSVRLRRIARHARLGVVRSVPPVGVGVAELACAVNVLLQERGDARRFVPVRTMPGAIALVLATREQSMCLADHDLIDRSVASDLRAFCRYSALALAS